ncbi:restriction endonuclease subunit S [Listeria monocytogenes]|uniref:Restriction endonuclease subunit S n=3 Tax=Listeria monocytogenes TaxID=1639 RepID=A0A456LML9_LISMN|nr:restriction endonuclease subunit S [Listeria monocytogenes]EAE3727765.1 restriction endonuclease subunit S [Listeria monocytogenes serotype 1/2b]EAF4480275.1 restriction endonuclease subunit S [Listeria monocytogenes serotype 4b]AJT44319.1 type I restriction endonuclease subunit S [Listeria monocytogenes]AMD23577.1 restriction endonuclease subunit S [Listeria monocytogenes]AQP84630.1 type I restriction endonuclease subunit S [Listeria monocytogenes]
MKKLEKSVPVIRFKGFSEAWEQRKLGDLVVDYVEKTSVQNQFPMLTSSQQKGIVLQEDYFANRQVTTENNIGYFVLPRGYFTFRSRSDNDVFVFNRNDIIDRGIISYFYPVFTLKSADSDFFLRRINNGIQRQLSIQAEGTGQHVLSLKKFKNIVAMFPSEGEQKKIGSFFKQLDDTIALHQRKLDTLKQMKKGLLQQMFPKSEEDVPKIRFADFDEEWYQRKLGEISDKVIEKNKESTYFETLTNSAEYGIISQREFFNKDISNEKNLNGYYIVRENDFVYNPRISNYAPVGPIKRNKLGRIGIVSPLYYVFRTFDTNQSFLEYYFDGTVWHNFMLLNGDSGARADRFAIKDSVLKEMPIPYSTLYEQEKISFFLDEITIIINLHQNKLKKLSSLKKAYLQNMFI